MSDAPVKKEIHDIQDEVMNIIAPQIFICRKSDCLSETLDDVINIFLPMYAFSLFSIVKPEERESFFNDNFPTLVNAFESFCKQIISKLNRENEK